MPRKSVLSAAKKRAIARNAYLRRKYGWTVRGLYDDLGRRIVRGAGYVGRGARYAASPVMWAGRKIYENPLGTAAMVGSGAMGVAAGVMLPGTMLASPILYFGVPVARHFASKYMPVQSTRFTRGLGHGIGMAMTGLSLAGAGGIPAALFHGAMGGLGAASMYAATKKLGGGGGRMRRFKKK